ncbi:DUF3575 domain-containing protein [Persicobacter sp. CCB-QB2]|uniref:DUF3575 domain-containing protein n=1 Tax=Persicobacter sp. CCB-QB2 TaxID=1561025 RepID=UPI0006A9CA8B|nr:DUF3575 domain-containing protein [Persicobacter sp. CCB-QB2]
MTRPLRIILLLLLCLRVADGIGQSVAEKKNIIRWNMTPWLLWESGSVILGYERVLTENMSASVNAGRLELPQFFRSPLPNMILNTQSKTSGVSVTADFRYYFNRNKFGAPDGVYVGPYYSYFNFGFEKDFVLQDRQTVVGLGNIYTDAYFQSHNWGIQLGYQFIIKERLALDFVLFGPSLSWYYGRIKVGGNIDPEIKDETVQDMVAGLMEQFPWMEKLINEQTIATSGRMNARSFGFRYLIQVGYYF